MRSLASTGHCPKGLGNRQGTREIRACPYGKEGERKEEIKGGREGRRRKRERKEGGREGRKEKEKRDLGCLE